MTAAPPPLALVTGGCRRLGAAIAAALASRGYALALHGHKDAEPDEALATALAAYDTDWRGFVAGLEEPEECVTLFSAITSHFGRAPNLLVNSASMFEQDRLADVTPDRLTTAISVNCASPVLLAQALSKSSDGAPVGVVNILDQRVRYPHGDQLAYTISKLALAGFTTTRGLPYNLRINGVAPGLTLPTDDYDEGRMNRLAGLMPLRRLPTPKQVADAVLFLAETPAIHGQILFVDGGASLIPFERDFMHLEES